jgi:hypothetical protein
MSFAALLLRPKVDGKWRGHRVRTAAGAASVSSGVVCGLMDARSSPAAGIADPRDYHSRGAVVLGGWLCVCTCVHPGRLNVHQALQRMNNKLYPEKAGLELVDPKGGYSDRAVMLPAVAIAALLRHQAAQQEEIGWAGTKWRNEWNLVFTTKVGTPLDERKVLGRFQNILASAGLPRMRIHDLRHSAVAILIAQGVNIKAISELLGHSSVAFTLQVYGHLLEETRREAADKMDAALSPIATRIATKPDVGRVN